jgi:UDP-N-acetylglucosamine acyltransferase
MDLTHTLRGINVVGLRRAGFSNSAIRALREAYRVLFGTRRNLKRAIAELETAGESTPEVAELVTFIRQSKRGVAFGAKYSSALESDGDNP